MIQYYVAEKGCSRGLQKRVMLAVDEKGEISFHRGHVDDKFEIGENGRPFCASESGYVLPYIIYGPLTQEQFSKLAQYITTGWGDFTKPKRIHSMRGIG